MCPDSIVDVAQIFNENIRQRISLWELIDKGKLVRDFYGQ